MSVSRRSFLGDASTISLMAALLPGFSSAQETPARAAPQTMLHTTHMTSGMGSLTQ